jgi:dephospho-CoA kinase
MTSRVPALIVHGGARSDPASGREELRRGIRDAVAAGWAILSQGGSAVAAVEAAVLERMGALNLVDRVLLVTAPAAQRGRRLAQRDGLSPAQAAARLRSQEQLGLDRPRADYVIANDGNLSDLARKVELFWAALV